MTTRTFTVIGVTTTLLLLTLPGIATAKDCGEASGPAGGRVECACGDTVTTDITLPGNLNCGNMPGLSVAGDSVLNLGTFTISGNRNVNMNEGVTIRGTSGGVLDGTIEGFRVGVGISVHADRNFVRDIKSMNNMTGVEIRGEENRVFDNREITGVTVAGIKAIGRRNEIENNRVTCANKQGIGIEIAGNQQKTVRDNSAQNCATGFLIRSDNTGNKNKDFESELTRNRADET